MIASFPLTWFNVHALACFTLAHDDIERYPRFSDVCLACEVRTCTFLTLCRHIVDVGVCSSTHDLGLRRAGENSG